MQVLGKNNNKNKKQVCASDTPPIVSHTSESWPRLTDALLHSNVQLLFCYILL